MTFSCICTNVCGLRKVLHTAIANKIYFVFLLNNQSKAISCLIPHDNTSCIPFLADDYNRQVKLSIQLTISAYLC